MAKKESTFINMVVALLLVTLVASTALGYIYEITKEPIAAAKLAKKIAAIKEVVPHFNNNPSEESFKVFVDGDSLVFYPAKMDTLLVGTAIETFTNKGFSGEIKLMVGLLPDGTINNIAVLEHKETPGLGDKMQKKKSMRIVETETKIDTIWWSKQFNDKNPMDFKLSVKKDGGDVDAITASTISSRAYCDAVSRAYKNYMNSKQGGNE